MFTFSGIFYILYFSNFGGSVKAVLKMENFNFMEIEKPNYSPFLFFLFFIDKNIVKIIIMNLLVK